MSPFRHLLLLTTLLLLLRLSESGFWRRRRRRGCSRVNCEWNNWTPWGPCSHPCGSAGIQSRSRSVRRGASCGGAACSGGATSKQACNRFCHNGGIPVVGHCTCPDVFWGTCCPNACVKIANCRDLVCHSGSDQQCRRCNYDYGGEKKAFRLAGRGGHNNRICEKICSWRPDSLFCYPGKCPDTPSSCRCAPGFGSTNCLTIRSKPSINYCHVTVEDGRTKFDVSCASATNSVLYSNIRPTVVKVDIKSTFRGPPVSTYPRKYYINDFKVGVTEATFTHRLVRGGSDLYNKNVACSAGSSQSRPQTALHACVTQDSIVVTTFRHADKFHFTTTVKNGGYVKTNNYDKGAVPVVSAMKYYTGQTTTHNAELVIDLLKPYHCSVESSCAENMLDVGHPVTKSATVAVRWLGWRDDLAGIKGYELEFYKMKVYGDKLSHHGETALVRKYLGHNVNIFNTTLAEPGVYAVVLTAADKAGNTRVARRFLIFDNKNVISIKRESGKQLFIKSAAENTSYYWLTTLQRASSPSPGARVVVSWRGHFINVFHHTHKFLAGISANSPPIDSGYEKTIGQPPTTVSREDIPNVNGIVKYGLGYAVDHQGGRTLGPNIWINVPNFQSETMTVDIPRADGDSVRVWVRATDVMGNTKTDSVLVHVDSSPPVIQDVWLSRHGRRQLAVHHSVDLFDLKFEFDSYDFHSGLKEIHWLLHDSLDPSLVHGTGHVVVRRRAGQNPLCIEPTCYSIPHNGECFQRQYEITPDMSKMTKPHGDHDFDYSLVLNVTNNAMLSNIFTFKITIDTTAPQPGVVLDSELSQPDVDFQQSFNQHASWRGFFDRESGVVFYQYAFSDTCLTAGDFAVPATGKVKETTVTYASRTVSGPGNYHCTVVAYNKALEPSEPVCSDGITVDTTAPEIHEVSIENSWTKDGLVKDSAGHVWYIDRNRFRVLIDQPSPSCRLKARPANNTLLYRVRQLRNSSGENSVTLCQKPIFPGQPNIVVRKENVLELSWFGSDNESAIHTYEVGLSTTGSEDMDLLSYTSTHGHRHFITYHPDLMGGQTFYIHIMAVNRAGKQTVQVTGPVVVQVEPPTFIGHLVVSTQQHDNVLYLVARWNSSSFSFTELRTGRLLGYSYGVGHRRGTDNVKAFGPLTGDSPVCTKTTPPTCVATPVGDLQWRLHGRHSYYVTLKLEGVNGLERVVSSQEYEHYVGAPSGGVVVEIPVNTTELMSEDIDHQSSDTMLHVAWHGFHHVDQTISYEVGVGTAPGSDNIDGFKRVDTWNKMITNLALQPFKTYYASVRAKTLDGSTIVSSDGITVLPVNTTLMGATVIDALPCLSHDPQSTKEISHHQATFPDRRCEADVDYQSSSTHVGIAWSLPANMAALITSVKWGIQETNSSLEVRELTDAERVSHVVATYLHLEPGHTYQAVVQFCHPDGCFLPLHSDGVTIIPDAPVSTGITAASLVGTNLTFSWAQFVDPSIKPTTSDIVSRYEWTLMVKHSVGHSPDQLYPWIELTQIHCVISEGSNNQMCSTFVPLAAPLVTTRCVWLAVRAYSKAGLYSMITRRLNGCDDTSKVTLTVVDAVAKTLNGDISLKKNDRWPELDRQYTLSVSTLSAVWPDLRHGTYAWKVVSESAINTFANNKLGTSPDYNDFDCSAPGVLSCGQTQDNFVNVHGLSLHEGQRYHICIQANATDLEFEKFTQHLEQNSECSNGIVVDTTPPVANKVWVGSQMSRWSYQIDRSQLNIYWNSFKDIEVYRQHHTGILKYEYAIGTSLGGVDVQDYTDVGLTNMAVASGLELQDGSTYFVTLRATDHVGLSTTAQSAGVTVDSTPPNICPVSIDVGGSYKTDTTEFSAAWKGVFDDVESGIEHYSWCLGSKRGYCDIMEYVTTTEPEASTKAYDTLKFSDGHPVYVTVQAMNKVGLTAVTTSRAVIVDASLPVAGHVYDVNSDLQTIDIDYTTVTTKIGASWSGFHDPHSHVTGYSINIGKCATCGDILQKSHVGISTSILLDHVTLERGVTYYTTVEACNGAGLCVTVTSDGIIADTSPPVAGVVYDGISHEDVEYQSDRSTLSAHWFNFHDPESALLYMEWWAGTTPGRSDILAPTRIHVTDKASTRLPQHLPLKKKVFITLKVFNKAGLSIEKTSNGFTVDNTSAVASTRMSLDRRFGSLKANTQVWKSSLSVLWKMSDSDSSIVEQFVSLTTRNSIHHNVPAVKLYGDEREYTFSNVSLADGETYYAKVIACNGARLCTTSVSEGILVDNTPPSAGAFAVDTEHTADLTRHRRGWMTYNNKVLRLAWLGFSDAHSDVTSFYVTVGKKYGASDMLATNEAAVVRTTTDDEHRDEGFVQKTEVTVTSTIQRNQQIYISVWAENEVGLVSSRLHGTFSAVPSQSAAGTLALVRRCQPVSCLGHCTCAPHGQMTCRPTRDCTNVKGKSGYQKLAIYAIEDYSVNPASNARNIAYTRSQCALAATWRTNATSAKAPERFEWSVGLDGEQIGHDLLDVLKESVWRDTGDSNKAVYTTGSSRKPGVTLESHTNYMLYVRAWYDDNSYAVYVTDGVHTDSSPPELSRASKVTDLQRSLSNADVDFITSTQNVTLSWSGVFRDSHAGVKQYVVAIGKHLGGREVHQKQVGSTLTQVVLSGLKLYAGSRYFSTVIAYNEAGLFRAAYSDGFKVDITPPVTGHVWDGQGLIDQDYSSDNRTVSAWWRGFSDDESYIDHYMWCVGTVPGRQDIVTCRDVGLHTRRTIELSSTLTPGRRLYSTVYAYNAAGLKSAAVSSDGYLVDSTPPRYLHKFQLGPNLLKNPSFEEDASRGARIPKNWNGQGTFIFGNSTGNIKSQDGHSCVDIVSGYLMQTITTLQTKKYRVTFYVRSSNTDRFHSQRLGFVRLPQFHRAFFADATSSGSWQKHVYYFIASGATSSIKIGALGHKTGFLLDNVAVQELGFGQRGPSADPRDPFNWNFQPVHVHLMSRGSYTAVTAAWDVEDTETPITGYSWAIGTVRGGVQLQNFRSVGRQTHARADALLLQHGTKVHVTVVAGNAAGLRTVIYSDPHIIDLTPPDLCCLVDGGNGADVSYQMSSNLSITWSVSDTESRIEYCEWAVGKSPSSQEVQPFTRTTSLSTASVTLDATVSHGETVFSVVRCFNYAGLQSTLVSSGVVIVSEPPDVSLATLNVITSSASYYAARDNHQSDRQNLFFGWDGIRDQSGTAGYEVSLQRANNVLVVPWTSMVSSTDLFAELQGLNLESYATYTLMMRVHNYANIASDLITGNVTIETEAPSVTGISMVNQWPNEWELKLDWTGMFVSNSTLLYEISIGTTRGGVDVQRPVETGQSRFRITGVDHTKEHHVTLTAFNKAGLYTTRTFLVACSHTSDTG